MEGLLNQSTFRLVFVCVAPNCHRITKAGTLAVHAKQKLLKEKERQDNPEKQQGAREAAYPKLQLLRALRD